MASRHRAKEKTVDRKEKIGLLRSILIAAALVTAFSLTIKPTIVRADSMLSTLTEGDYLLVNKLAYAGDREPQRGDIIVFHDEGFEDGGKLLIKRVIACEGDTITFKGNKVYLNGKVLEEPYVYNEPDAAKSYNEGDTFRIGEGEYFVMGDHRSVSLDSRAPEIGYVAEDDIMGKAFVRLYPFNKLGGL